MIRISLITPTNNSEKTIIRNVQSILKQTFKEFEHIIIDNLSSDGTVQLIKNAYEKAGLSLNLKIISEKDTGISDAFNKGIRNSNSDVIGILNSDDYFSDEFVLERVSKEFLNENILFVHGNVFFKDELYGSNVRKPLLCPIQEAMPFNHPTMFFRKIVYEKYGLFSTSYQYAMDYEFICRLENLIPNFRSKGIYLDGNPLCVMSAGGVSWENEVGGLNEVKRSLMQHGFWNLNAKLKYLNRILRTRLKHIMNITSLTVIIKIWRNLKWS